jgi:hypothetical protein
MGFIALQVATPSPLLRGANSNQVVEASFTAAALIILSGSWKD